MMSPSLPARAARALIFVYRVTFSAFAGRFCRYAPTCSEYADEAIAKHGLWAGGWMAFARICRCRPGGGAGFDPAPATLRADASPLTPWRYGVWRQRLVCEAVAPEDKTNAGRP
nr:membrane protein insertion efficiency factor YidD [Methylocystis sp. SC2]